MATGRAPGAAAGQLSVAVRSVTAPTTGRPGAPGVPAVRSAGSGTRVVSEYAGRVCAVALPVVPVVIAVAPLPNECTVGAPAAGVQPA